MADKLIGYKNKLWRVIHDFKYTGNDQPFTLQNGQYLLICKGAPGGMHRDTPLVDECIPELGGVAYGVINVDDDPITLHAIVGGKGGDNIISDEHPGEGGFNGGSPGGKPTARTNGGTMYRYGVGGGGASDIRILPYDPNEYPTYNQMGEMTQPANPSTILYDVLYDESNPSDEHRFHQVEWLQTLGRFDTSGTSDRHSSFLTDYYPKSNTKIKFDGVFISSNDTHYDWWVLFGSRERPETRDFAFFYRSLSSNNPAYCRNNHRVHGSDLVYDERITVECYKEKAEWFLNGVSKGSILIPDYEEYNSTYPLGINGICGDGWAQPVIDFGGKMQLYRFTISEITDGVETVVRDYVPAQRISDGKVGIFDTIANVFIPPYQNTNCLCGERVRSHPSIDSRIIVAGGGGGASYIFDSAAYHGLAGGGGVEGGYIHYTAYQYEPNYKIHTNQTCGYTRGYSIPGSDHYSWAGWSVEGSSGGGGGWYGGYTNKSTSSTATQLCCNGGGGSGYVLTSTSYKPDGYNPDSKYYLTDTFMSQAQSHEPEIIVAKLTQTYSEGDVIEFPSVAESCKIDLSPGIYNMKCYGGDGGYRYHQKHSVRGGFTEGDVELHSTTQTYVNVGGSANPRWNWGGTVWADTHASSLKNTPNISYNGGGAPDQNENPNSISGGGATDIRFEVNDLNHRVIVAGGAGSEGCIGKLGGVGGGLTGGALPSTGAGSTNGPGTQTESPSDVYANTAGSFGQGGTGMYRSDGYGGSGGGGWYGGSGTYPDGSQDNDSGGTGGSGYVLTNDSYKPEGYAFTNNEYSFTNTSTVAGGNDLNLFETKAVITVGRLLHTMLLKDDDGFKYYDIENSIWRLMSPQPARLTKSVFEEYETSVFLGDNGINAESTYEVYVYSEDEEFESVSLLHCPNSTMITVDTDLRSEVLSYYVEEDAYDHDIFSPQVYCDRDSETKKVSVIADVTKLEKGDYKYKIYSSDIVGKGGTSPNDKHRYMSLEEVTPTTDCDPNNPCYGTLVRPRGEMEDYRDDTGHIATAQWLLQTRIRGTQFAQPKYYSEFTDQGVTDRHTSVGTIHNRTAYFCSLVYQDNWYIQIKRVNLFTNEIVEEAKFLYTDIFNGDTYSAYYSISGFLVDDESYYMLIGKTNNDSTTWENRIHVIKRSDLTHRYYQSTDTTYESNAYGRIEWLDDNRDTIVYITANFIKLFNVHFNTFTHISIHQPTYYEDFAVGEKYVLLVSRNNDQYSLVWMNKTTHEIEYTTVTNYNADQYKACCYHDGKFYIAINGRLYSIYEDTHEVYKQYVIPYTNPTNIIYCNDAVFITQASSQWLYIFNVNTEVYSTVYLTYSTSGIDVTIHKTPTVYRSIYLDPNAYALMVINYQGSSKYKFGYKYNQYIANFNQDNIENITYDPNFVTITDSCAIISDGFVEYELTPYDSQHIASITVDHNAYRSTYGSKVNNKE